MMNDVVFNNTKSAYDDWNIVLVKTEVPLPSVKTSTVTIKGADGVLDLSDVLTGDVNYNNRTVKLTFEVMDDTDFHTLIGEISNYLHGKTVTVRLTHDNNCYMIGRASINSWECIKRKGKIVITVDCEPYKYAVKESVTHVSVNGATKSVTLTNGRKKVCPKIIVSGDINMIFDGVTYELNEGEQQLLNFVLNEGHNLVKFSGNGTVTVTYRMGWL